MANYKLVPEFNLPNGGIAQNVYYARVDFGENANQSDLISDLGDEMSRILTPWLAQVASNVVLALVRIYIFAPLLGTSAPVGVVPVGTNGTGSIQAMPGPVAVKYSQYLPGRPRPFGVYLSGADEAGALNNGRINTTMQAAALATAAASTVDTVMSRTGLTFQPRVYSPKDLELLSLEGANNEVNDVFDYQRRRKAGRGV